MTAHLNGTWALRVAVLVGGWCDLAAVHLAGGETPLWLWATATALSIATAARPGSLVPLLALGTMLAAWLAAPDGVVSAWVLLAAAGVVGSHVAALLLDLRPPRAAVPTPLVRLWVRRSGLLWLSSGACWAAARVTTAPTGDLEAGVRISALVLLGLGAVGLSIALGTARRPAAGERG
ncbi:MAG TPA: hypothetical protein VHO29_09890 [Marmoricola sp.]|nr:hypothetical protein [Marmoricola sp.]